MSNDRAQALLEKAGINCEPEPNWIEDGRKPDFYCPGRFKFWCEVKTRERSPDFKLLGDALNELKQRCSGISLPGQGVAYVNSTFNHRDAKAVVNLLRRALGRFADKDAPAKVVALIPADPDYRRFVRFSISTRDHAAVEFHCCVSETGKYPTLDGLFPEPYGQMVRLHLSPDNSERKIPARKLMGSRSATRVAIVIEADERPFDVLFTMLTRGATKLKNPEWIRDAVNEANEQFKNGCKFLAAPCLLILFHDGLDVPEDMLIQSGLYGDLQYQFSPGRSEAGRLIVAGNGAWNPNKNRSTSAVMYVRNGSQPLIVHNFWAHRRFPEGLFACREFVARQDGTFQETDFSVNKATRLFRSLARHIQKLISRWSERIMNTGNAGSWSQ